MLRWLINRGGFSVYGQFMCNACGGLMMLSWGQSKIRCWLRNRP
ncbi:hypothetical protein HMPREF0670_01361 [Prevotella sp. oral taxon 317 str. F0108]|nr:hypothetical protein HMPREF0670_01361 [Prevotella sp. oral taxon 317 str. F0108]